MTKLKNIQITKFWLIRFIFMDYARNAKKNKIDFFKGGAVMARPFFYKKRTALTVRWG
jgi:hypothetical protein